PVDHAALELHLDRARIDHVAAVAGDHHALDPDLAAAADAHLGDHADDRIVALVNRHAAALAGRHGLAPVAFRLERIEADEEVRAMGEQRSAERQRVLPGRKRHLVDKTLHEEYVLTVAGRPPGPERHVRVLE